LRKDDLRVAIQFAEITVNIGCKCRFPLYTPQITVMQPGQHRGEIFRFGPFEVDPAERVLRKRRVRIRLQTQPFLLLTALLENSGTVVTREELRRRIWPEHTFVDFEHGLQSQD
jgi:DNA-binding response OmpR family regulator